MEKRWQRDQYLLLAVVFWNIAKQKQTNQEIDKYLMSTSQHFALNETLHVKSTYTDAYVCL